MLQSTVFTAIYCSIIAEHGINPHPLIYCQDSDIGQSNYRPSFHRAETLSLGHTDVEALTLKINEEQSCIDWLLMVKEHLTEIQ